MELDLDDFEDFLELFASCGVLLGSAVAALLSLWFFLYLLSLRTQYSLKGKHILVTKESACC